MQDKKKNITILDIAKKLNIAASTVSRALNDHPKINIKTKEMVWDLAKKMGYYQNMPDYMSKNTSNKVCIIIPEFDTFHIDIIEGAKQYFDKKSISYYVACSNQKIELEQKIIAESIELGFKGFIISVFDINQKVSSLKEAIPDSISKVLINKFEEDIQASKIIPDIYDGAFKAVSHLNSVGCENIALIVGEQSNPFYFELLFGYESALNILNLENNQNNVFITNFKQDDIAYGMDKLLNQKNHPDGIIAATQLAAQQIISYLRNIGINVPQDILIVSFGDEKFNSFVSPTLTSIHISGNKIGRVAAKQLAHSMLDKTLVPVTVVEQAKLIIRGSSMRPNQGL